MNFGSKITNTIDFNLTHTNVELGREMYERDLKERQDKHLARFKTQRPWQPCLHDQCQSCHGTGINQFGGACIHGISCSCPKCTPSY